MLTTRCGSEVLTSLTERTWRHTSSLRALINYAYVKGPFISRLSLQGKSHVLQRYMGAKYLTMITGDQYQEGEEKRGSKN